MPPEAFSIRLLPASERDLDGERLGEICIGSFFEGFGVYAITGSVEDVAAGWTDALRSLLAGSPAVGLPTAPNMTWVLYRHGSAVFVQQMLMLPGFGPRLSPDGRVEHIPAHREVSEDGGRISQWETTIKAIAAFVRA